MCSYINEKHLELMTSSVDYCLLTNIAGTESSIGDIETNIDNREFDIIGDIETSIQTNTVDKY